MKRIRDIVGSRTEVYTVQKTDSVRHAAQEMTRRNVRAISVLDGDRLVGILSEWDIMTKVVAEGRDPETTRVEEIMTPDPMTATPDATYAECLVTMLANDFQHLVVVTTEGKVLGTVSLGDLLSLDKKERDEALAFYERFFQIY
ncbi:MAG: CBS domain-containing protein [Blastocatellia bacterium]|nr:CBS domain-containing protein [Blastocatellia bacterium]MCS7157559.1 CBS domain-containing protein [Blastocatellia bacterium]MCX7753511.1 CBS domain-containing protein [Blastocatellia bacterium]MDW8166927.1 CBS domain-containing protein [Acidobacteriota bacterium]MDW8257504.1 CBS domain-containing protein [Acidobacteriota bacterium]